jgi:DNA-binding transcriptional ArsR family regulator
MKVSPSSLMPLFRSDVQGRLLGVMFASPEQEFSVSELAKRADTSLPTALREIARLAEAGVVSSRQLGNLRLSQVNNAHPLYRELHRIVLYTFGPKEILAQALAELPGVSKGFIFGSWAARYLGEPGDNPGDIDVLLVGRFKRSSAHEIAVKASSKIGKVVNVHNLSEDDWKAGQSGFIRTIRSRPLVQIVGESDVSGTKKATRRESARDR